MTNERPQTQLLRPDVSIAASVVVIACVVGNFGCTRSGPQIAPVSGTVTLDGKPLPNGVVSFVSEAGFASSAPLDADGRFQLVSQFGQGAPLGTYRVTLSQQSLPPSAESTAPRARLPRHEIPERYHYLDRSGISLTVEDRPNTFAIELFSK